MKFFITKAFLVALTFRVGSSAEKINLNGRDDNSRREDSDFWKSIMLEDVDSMAIPTKKPTTKPTAKPIATSAPVVVSTPAPSKVKPISYAPSGEPSLNAASNAPSTSGPSSSSCQSIGMC